MPPDDFAHLTLRLEEQRAAIDELAPHTPVTLSREAILDIYEAIERMARALRVLEER
jgi:hypothetical protein